MTPTRIWRFAVLANPERQLLVEAWLRLTMAAIALRFLGFRRLIGGTAPAVKPATNTLDPSVIQRRATSIERAARHLFLPAMCLPRSIALHQWLRRDGIASELRIGVRKLGSGMAAHAWVEVNGSVVYESTDAASRFTPLQAPDGSQPTWGLS
jgi:hypothetical protein